MKSEALVRFGITARQFNGVRFDLDQAVNVWKGSLEFRVSHLKDSIQATQERIERLVRRVADATTERRRASARFRHG